MLTSHTNGDVKAFQKVKEFREEEWEVYDGHLAVIRKKFDDSLDHNLKDVYDAFYLEVDQLEMLCSGVQIHWTQLNLQKLVWDEALMDEESAPNRGSDAWLCMILIGHCAFIFSYNMYEQFYLFNFVMFSTFKLTSFCSTLCIAFLPYW